MSNDKYGLSEYSEVMSDICTEENFPGLDKANVITLAHSSKIFYLADDSSLEKNFNIETVRNEESESREDFSSFQIEEVNQSRGGEVPTCENCLNEELYEFEVYPLWLYNQLNMDKHSEQDENCARLVIYPKESVGDSLKENSDSPWPRDSSPSHLKDTVSTVSCSCEETKRWKTESDFDNLASKSIEESNETEHLDSVWKEQLAFHSEGENFKPSDDPIRRCDKNLSKDCKRATPKSKPKKIQPRAINKKREKKEHRKEIEKLPVVRKVRTYNSENLAKRKRTKLKSSGEGSSAYAMDLSKRRDVVNKTILRILRRFFTTKLKEFSKRNFAKEGAQDM